MAKFTDNKFRIVKITFKLSQIPINYHFKIPSYFYSIEVGGPQHDEHSSLHSRYVLKFFQTRPKGFLPSHSSYHQ